MKRSSCHYKKGGAKAETVSYRPVSLTSVVGKVTKRLLATRIRGTYWGTRPTMPTTTWFLEKQVVPDKLGNHTRTLDDGQSRRTPYGRNLHIPGYFYDAQKKKYFKIEKHELPTFVTQITVATKSASEQAARCLRNIRHLIRPSEVISFTTLVDQLERRGYSSDKLASHYSRMNLCRFQNQSSFAVQPISHCLLSSTGAIFHGTSSSSFNTYRLFWSSQQKRKRQKRTTMSASVSHTSHADVFHVQQISTTTLPGLVQDWRWCSSGSAILALCNAQSGLELITIQESATGFHYVLEPDSGVRLPYTNSAKLVHHVTASVNREDTSSGPEEDLRFDDGTVLVYTRVGVYRLGHGLRYPLYTTSQKHCRRVEPKVYITACSETCSGSPRTTQPRCYVSTASENGDRKVSLLQFDAFSSTRPLVLLSLGSCTSFSSDVTHIEPLLSETRSVRGVLTRSASGLMQLWDDRWTRHPVLSYRGSDCGRLHTLASHIAPQPVVDLKTFNCVACPLPACSTIAFWDVWSGSPIHQLDYSADDDRPSSAPPPHLFLRASWPNFSAEHVRGPGMLLVDQTEIHWFDAS